jgi:hypothetical protein
MMDMIRLDSLPVGAFRLPACNITGIVEHVSPSAVRVRIRRRPGIAEERTEWAPATEVLPDTVDADAIRQCLCHAVPVLVARKRPRQPDPDAPLTFAQFARAGRRLGWSVDFLTRQFKGRIEAPGDFFSRVFDRHDRFGAVVIPYRSVLDWYLREIEYSRTRGRRAA